MFPTITAHILSDNQKNQLNNVLCEEKYPKGKLKLATLHEIERIYCCGGFLPCFRKHKYVIMNGIAFNF